MANNAIIVIGTKNPGKFTEMCRLLHVRGVVYTHPVKEIPDVDETGVTFKANAILKAKEICRATGFPVVADDSGIEVRSLGWYPGVFSARWAGPAATDIEKATTLLEQLSGIQDRVARMTCVVALAVPGLAEEAVFFSGTVDGKISTEVGQSGKAGLGYDSIFIPDGYSRPFSELSAAVKDQISHRALACRSMRSYIRAVFLGPQNK